MDLNELNAFVGTKEGTAWLEEQKAGLITKNSELLGAVKQSNARLATEAQRADGTQKLLDQERAAVERIVVDGQLQQLLKDAGVIETLIPGVLAELRASHAATIVADGLDRKAVAKYPGADGNLEDVALPDLVKRWADTPGAKAVRRAPGSTGGGAAGGAGGAGSSKTMPLDRFEAMQASEKFAFMRSGGRIE